MVRDGRIAVNGKTMTALPVLVDPDKDRVTVDGERVRLSEDRRGGKPGAPARPAGERLYILMNKPKGVYTTNAAQGEQTRAIDLIRGTLPGRLYPVGQLESEAKGLLLLTNDGDLTNRLTHPRYGVAKTYRATVDGEIEPQVIDELQRGVWVGDRHGKGYKTGRCDIRIIKRMREKSILEITLREGKNRELRRMLAGAGHKVRDLTRVRIGPLTLDGLNPGDYRELTPRELKELKRLARAEAPQRPAAADED
jgi:23S rRNA pseudouridine2605 synthase